MENIFVNLITRKMRLSETKTVNYGSKFEILEL